MAPAFLDLPPLLGVSGTVRLPGSKSISNRVLLLAGLSAGRTRIHDLLDSDDTRVMIDALRTLGCAVETHGGSICITGLAGRLSVHEAQLFLGNAGTAMRPLAAALALLAATQGGCFELSGVARMHERPIGDLIDALRSLGCSITCLSQPGYPPLRLEGPTQLRQGTPICVRGDVSSQFLTALLMALPLVAAEHERVIEVEGELISKPYIEITLALLERFGVHVRREGWQRFTLPASSVYRSPGDIHVEGDASSASYFIAAGAIAATEAPLRIEGAGIGSIQGDIRFIEAARAMGADIVEEANALQVRRGAWPLKAITLDCNHIPDAAMTLAMMALYADGTTRLTNIASWRVKETDRIAAMAAELRKFGARVVEGADFIEVGPPTHWRAASIHTYDDHRMAMCASLAAFNALAAGAPESAGVFALDDQRTGGTVLDAKRPSVPVRVLDPRCVGKTFPDYFSVLFSIARADRDTIPVLTVDGPTASGKGTLGNELALRLGYHHLDSGALYRATALAALRAGIDANDERRVAALARQLPLRFDQLRALLGGEDVTDALRAEAVGSLASQVAALPAVRKALLELQLSFRRLPGLVADGRDMGSVVFPDAALKVFLTASAATRAERRHKQLISKGISANLSALRDDLEARDARDQNRSIAPLKAPSEAKLLDNSALSIDASVEQVLDWWAAMQPFGRGSEPY
ncbi:MAG: bifunctional 3-phosphoshikimate 1-carboxyvinyltransferase/cytidylate kinase [Methylibium sp.]|nr:bifunctional 3-phosphoshikimate 1-carboxyvinyltransferase/cytidylate kinase [Methylibium sp.]